MNKPVHVTHTDIESFAACDPMDNSPGDACLLTTIGSVEVSAIPTADHRGLMVTIEEPLERVLELGLNHPIAIRNAVYAVVNAVVNAIGESLQFSGMGADDDVPPWYEFEALTQWNDD
ncbi:hypothetical protein FF011L_05560 [Roseimaritima multifibrata]|uniref:Uncharacterized protein n=1 Tax=Roseimaritima multifibrata TaxID=1930274 RepID=A0A517MAE7_9BACT|nr:hypothetical protein [Roseimaritima multifibrata]QDS91821.1 hypothetical protein FF011L_05560 [Roseimaritima multifibrata]